APRRDPGADPRALLQGRYSRKSPELSTVRRQILSTLTHQGESSRPWRLYKTLTRNELPRRSLGARLLLSSIAQKGEETMRFLRLAAAAALLLLPLGSRAESDIPISNWTAPPYWSEANPREDNENLSARHALARQALVASPNPVPFVALTPCRVADTRP